MPLPLADAPRDLKLGPDNDVVITTDLQFTTGIAAVAQSCRIALQMFKGEWFLDLDIGIPYWDEILGQKPAAAAALARQEFQRELLEVDGVLDIQRLDVEYDRATRTMTITWQVLTALGETPLDTLSLEVA